MPRKIAIVEDDGDAVLVVGDAKAVSKVAVNTERLLRQHPLWGLVSRICG